VSTPDQRARDKDRDAAIEIVEAAWADGQIVQADRDHRVESLLRAQTLAEIRMITHDLQSVTAAAEVPSAAELYGSPSSSSDVTSVDVQSLVKVAAPKVPAMVKSILVFVVIAVIGSFGAGIFAIVRSVSDFVQPTISNPLTGVQPEEGVDLLSQEGYRDLLGAVEETSGSTDAFEAVLYPTYGVVYLPVDGDTKRQALWYYDGGMDDLESYGTSFYERFDLADVDPKVVVRLVKRVRGLVESPTSYYAILRAPDADDGSSIWVYASNEYSETAYLGATADGTVIYDSTDPPG
jgi:hypothetical protein